MGRPTYPIKSENGIKKKTEEKTRREAPTLPINDMSFGLLVFSERTDRSQILTFQPLPHPFVCML
ncbi:hypothetical protein TcasGA2_TC013281 [Tribolium castaneum]|uniref:Uncharacterized protein n=1 Tax=Tribolium castaneum TaxID=7070 RepID=D6WUG1_TRICA|nr:hypothetical protein TcasGA2_TC013281 [Tribolium castaneum]